jgi:hypothetical protein
MDKAPFEVIGLKRFLLVLVAAVAAMSCSSVKKVVVKDIPLQEQEAVLNKYKDRDVWTRVTIHDMGDGGSITRDEKVKIVDVAMHYKGSVTVQTLKKKNRIVQGLELDRPLTPEKIDAKLNELFWFDDPTIRHVKFIRKYGKKTAQAIMDHQLYVGMPAAAAMDSWGPPMSKQTNELSGIVNERWIYPTDNAKKTKALDLQGDTKSNGALLVKRWDE